jgi:protein tyrosine phosphatase
MNLIAIQTGNQPLNRFQNIIPYDFNRVILSTKPDYINASHIAIPIGEKSMNYIICPPPVPDSISQYRIYFISNKHFLFLR